MDFHDLGSAIWAILVVIAVISSIARSAKRSLQSVPTQRPATVQQPAAVQREASPQRPPPRVQPAPLPVIPRPSTSLGTGSTRSADSRDRRQIFERDNPVARGIIALEVLGPPRALRDWTPLV